MPAKDEEKNRELGEGAEPQPAGAAQEPGVEAAPGSAKAMQELSPEERLERAKQLIEEHQRAYQQRIEDAKARIRMRGEWSRARSIGKTYTYTVQAGDTLEAIAKAFFTKPERWPEIYEANKEAIPDPEALEAGVILIIP